MRMDKETRIKMSGVVFESSYIERLRRLIEEQYSQHPTGCGNSFGEILCFEIHERGLTFQWLAQKWGISITALGEIIYDHCKRLEADPLVDHSYKSTKPNVRLLKKINEQEDKEIDLS